MIVSIEKKKYLEKAFIRIELETLEEVEAFKNILTLAQNQLHSMSNGADLLLEKDILTDLEKQLKV